MNEEYKYTFFKTELDNILNSQINFETKRERFFNLVELFSFDASSLLSEIEYFYQGKDSFSDIFPKVIRKFHYTYYVWGGHFFDEKHSESNKNLTTFYNDLSSNNHELYKKFIELLKVLEQDYRLGVLYWFDNDTVNFEKHCTESLSNKGIDENPFIWLQNEVKEVRNKILNALIELQKVRKNYN